jgi:SAM-dependent methyltransferase
MMPPKVTAPQKRSPGDAATIADFGEQWTRFRDNSGYYGSTALFADFVGPLLDLAEIKGARVVDIGSGTGRIVNMLLDLDAGSVLAVEPSAAFDVLCANTAARADRVRYRRAGGEALPADASHDLVVSLGVLHHIRDPRPVVSAAFGALKPGGKIVVWLYGYEGNEAYLRFVLPLRRLTTRLPHWALAALTWPLGALLALYVVLCRFLPLPLKSYCRGVLARLPPDKRRLVIYDQLNPAYAKYYTGTESSELLADAGFVEVRRHHRHANSWTVAARKP